MSFAKDKDPEKTNISWYQSWDIWVFLKQKSVSKLLTFEKQKVMKFHEKLSRKRWQVINFSPLSSQNSSETFWNSKLPSTDFYIWYLKLTSRFKTRTLKLAFSKFQPWSNTEVKKTYKSKKSYSCNKALKHLPQILFCLLTTPYSHGNVVVQKKGY